MKGCELCGKGGEAGVGMMYCEADSARLCWECDAAVHGANFLVAKHTRVLLCHACHAPTQWRASGSSLSPALSICPACHVAKEDSNEEEEEVEEEGYSWSGTDEDEGEGENQVVPWSPVRAAAAAIGGGPSVASSSSSDDGGGLKRLRDDGGDSDPDHDDSEDETSSLPLRKRPRTLLVDAQPQHNNNQEQNSLHQSCRGRNGSTDEIIKRLRKGMSKNEETTILRTEDTNNLD